MNAEPPASSSGDQDSESGKTSAHDPTRDLQNAQYLLRKLKTDKPRVVLLSTVSESGNPHTTWMYASRSTAPGLEILTITSPDSDKVKNILANPKVEWLLTSKDRLRQLYLYGEASIIEEVAEIRQLWNMIGDKDRLFFVKYYNSGLGFSIVRTRVESAVYVAPEQHHKAHFAIEELIS